ncbi:hypothetical protein [Bradyrhizobium sp. WSM4349]|uniref:hypothetical protein n=1 Tax=Bradyrhizobium sp. WSM4349 TaxID=1040988 RepID=UPI0012F88861|nr:hypothetical protein [Bradyrhizobium sp. WSM4349]
MATLVHLAHAAKFLKNAGHGVELKLTASDPPIDDVLNNARNISVHMLSGGAKADDYDNYVRVAAVEGKGIGMQWADGTNLENEYDDDVAFFYGAHRIYLVRHLERFTATARQKANTYFREQLRAAGHPAPPDNHFL